MTLSKAVSIINPISGTGAKNHIAKQLSDLDGKEFDMTICWTEYPKHGAKIAKEAAEAGVEYIIAVGGDGTVNEIGGAIAGTNSALGIIPMGSGNGLARHLHVPMSDSGAIEVIRKRNCQYIDYGTANGHQFFCTCGVGFDATVSDGVRLQRKRGKLMYGKSILKIFQNYQCENYKLTTTHEIFNGPAFTITCANASQYGYNALIAPEADIQDGQMNIIILKPLSPWEVPQTTFQLFTGLLYQNPRYEQVIANRVLIEREKNNVMHVDGDAVKTNKNIEIKVIQHGLKVLYGRP